MCLRPDIYPDVFAIPVKRPLPKSYALRSKAPPLQGRQMTGWAQMSDSWF